MNKKHGSMTIDELRLNQFSNQQKNIDPLIILHSKFDND